MSAQAERYSWIANTLNRAAYTQQMEGRKTPLRQFRPCAKAVLFTAAIANKRPFYDLLNEVSMTPCSCHQDFAALEIEKLYNLAVDLFPQGNQVSGQTLPMSDRREREDKMNQTLELRKVAWIRDLDAPMGQPALGHLNCPCGKSPESKLDESNGDVTCACGKVYTWDGWVVKNTFEQDYIMDLLGVENWQHVLDKFSGSSLPEIWLKLCAIFPTAENTNLARMIYAEVNR